MLLYAAFSIYSGKNGAATEKIGKLQLEIINLQQEGEARLFYLDQLAKYAAQNTLNKMIKENKLTEKNFAEDFRKEFEVEFMNLLSVAYFNVPKEYSFEVKLEKEKLIVSGDAKKEIVSDKGSANVVYGVEHDFVQEIIYEPEKKEAQPLL